MRHGDTLYWIDELDSNSDGPVVRSTKIAAIGPVQFEVRPPGPSARRLFETASRGVRDGSGILSTRLGDIMWLFATPESALKSYEVFCDKEIERLERKIERLKANACWAAKRIDAIELAKKGRSE